MYRFPAYMGAQCSRKHERYWLSGKPDNPVEEETPKRFLEHLALRFPLASGVVLVAESSCCRDPSSAVARLQGRPSGFLRLYVHANDPRRHLEQGFPPGQRRFFVQHRSQLPRSKSGPARPALVSCLLLLGAIRRVGTGQTMWKTAPPWESVEYELSSAPTNPWTEVPYSRGSSCQWRSGSREFVVERNRLKGLDGASGVSRSCCRGVRCVLEGVLSRGSSRSASSEHATVVERS